MGEGHSNKLLSVFRILHEAALAGEVCPKNLEISAALGFRSHSTVVRIINLLEQSGQIKVVRGARNRIVTIAPDGPSTAGEVGAVHWTIARNRRAKEMA